MKLCWIWGALIQWPVCLETKDFSVFFIKLVSKLEQLATLGNILILVESSEKLAQRLLGEAGGVLPEEKHMMG